MLQLGCIYEKYRIYGYSHTFTNILHASALIQGQHERSKMPCTLSINSPILNLIVCQKNQLNRGRISPLKRKAQHRRKRIQKEKLAETKR
jgi:hypothetical protein